MPAIRHDLLGSIPGSSPDVMGPGSVTTKPDVRISIYRCTEDVERQEPPYRVSGTALEVMIEFQWSRGGIRMPVLDFSRGDILFAYADNPENDERIRQGVVLPAGASVGALSGGENGTYTLPIVLNPNSAGTVFITILPDTAFVIVGEGEDAENAWGPERPVETSFSYSTVSGTDATTTAPEVDIIVPTAAVYNQSIAIIRLRWNSDITTPPQRISVGPDTTDDVQITSDPPMRSFYVPNSFGKSGERTFLFNVDLSSRSLGSSMVPRLIWRAHLSDAYAQRITWNTPILNAAGSITVSGTWMDPKPTVQEFTIDDIDVYIPRRRITPNGIKSPSGATFYDATTGTFSMNVSRPTDDSGSLDIIVSGNTVPSQPDQQQIFIEYDRTANTISQTVNTRDITFLADWSQDVVNNIELSDLTITGGVVPSFRYSQLRVSLYINIIPSANQGSIMITVPAGLVDQAGGGVRIPNAVSNNENSVTGTYDFTANTLTLATGGDSEQVPGTSGTCIITVKADQFQDTGGDTGPPEDVTASFQFDTTLNIPTASDGVTGTNVRTIYDSQETAYNATDNVILGSDGGAFKGVSDVQLIGNQIYATVQVQRQLSSTSLNQGAIATARFIRMPNQLGSTPRLIESYESIVDSARSPILYDSNIYYFTGSHYRESSLGEIKFVPQGSSTVGSQGIPWRSRLLNPQAATQEDNISYSNHVRTASSMAVIGDRLFGAFGYGNTVLSKSLNWESAETPEGRDDSATRVDNWILITFDRAVPFRVPVLQSSGRTPYEIIQSLARMSFCFLGFDGDRFLFKPKFQPKARLNGDINHTNSISTIEYERPNIQLPESGYVRISGNNQRSEIFSYTGRTETQLTGVIRAQLGSTANQHCDSDIIEFFHYEIDMNDAHEQGPINELNVTEDFNQLFNIVSLTYGSPEINEKIDLRDASSIEANTSRELKLEHREISNHDDPWALWLAQQYLRFYGTIKSVLNVTLKLSPYIKVADFVMLTETRKSLIEKQIFQVVLVNHSINPSLTRLQLRTVELTDSSL